MPTPTPDDINLARRGATDALERLRTTRTPRDDGDDAPGRIAAVETLWWVRLLAEQLAYPCKEGLSGDGTESDVSELVAALRVVRNTVTHKVPIVAAHEHADMAVGTNAVLGVTKLGGEVELCWIPADELPRRDNCSDAYWAKEKSIYAEHVAGQPCWVSLKRAVTWLTGDAPKCRADGTLVELPTKPYAPENPTQDHEGSGITLG